MTRKSRNEWKRQYHAPADWTLTSYGPDEGPDYPRCSKKGNVGEFFRKLQTKELYACTKGIFAEVDMTYSIPAPRMPKGGKLVTIDNNDVRNFAFSRADELAKTFGWRFDLVQRKQTHAILNQLLAA